MRKLSISMVIFHSYVVVYQSKSNKIPLNHHIPMVFLGFSKKVMETLTSAAQQHIRQDAWGLSIPGRHWTAGDFLKEMGGGLRCFSYGIWCFYDVPWCVNMCYDGLWWYMMLHDALCCLCCFNAFYDVKCVLFNISSQNPSSPLYGYLRGLPQ